MRISPGPGRRGGFGERESVAGRCVPVSTATKIEWTRGDDGTAGATWNPVTGCTKVSEGCDHCYAETFAERWRGVPGHPFEQGFEVRLWPERLTLPLRWRRPRRVFVDSMSDLWHDAVGADLIAQVFAVIAVAGQHTFQVLTKRPGRMCSLLGDDGFWDQVGQAAAGSAMTASGTRSGRQPPGMTRRRRRWPRSAAGSCRICGSGSRWRRRSGRRSGSASSPRRPWRVCGSPAASRCWASSTSAAGWTAGWSG